METHSAAMDADMDEESSTPAIGAEDGDMEVERLLQGERDNGVEVDMDMDSAARLVDDVLAALPELGRDDQILPAWEN